MIGKVLSAACGILLVVLMVAFPLRAKAVTTLFVSSTSGSDVNLCTSGSPCMTIGRAISLAGSGDTINVAAGLYSTPNEVFPLTINLALTITGAGASSTIIDARKTHRVISFSGTANLSISGVTITGGKTPEAIGNGGGILDNSTAKLTLADSIVTGNAATNDGGGIAEEAGSTVNLSNCTVSHNTADDDGGGIAEDGGGTINLMNCTISDNRGSLDGGGIAEEGSGTVNLINCTVSGNTTDGFGGGIAADGGGIITMNNCTISYNRAPTGGGIDNDAGDSVTLSNTIVANNLPGGDCATTSGSSITSKGHNLDSDGTCGLSAGLGDVINKNPRLGPLALNPPGTTATRGLIVGSPAIDAGDPGPSDGMGNHCEPTDQRGVTRPEGLVCDIGAFEGQIQPPSSTGAPALGVSGLLLTALGLAALGARRVRYRTANASGRTA